MTAGEGDRVDPGATEQLLARGWASTAFSSCVVRFAPATTSAAATASRGRPRTSAIAQATASIASSGSGSQSLASAPAQPPAIAVLVRGEALEHAQVEAFGARGPVGEQRQ